MIAQEKWKKICACWSHFPPLGSSDSIRSPFRFPVAYKSLSFSLTLPLTKKKTLQLKKKEEIKRKLFQFDFQTSLVYFSFLFFPAAVRLNIRKCEAVRENMSWTPHKKYTTSHLFWASKFINFINYLFMYANSSHNYYHHWKRYEKKVENL